MRKLRLLLATTALIAAGSAFADDNFANVDQDGMGNSASVTQGPGSNNLLGSEDDAARQYGDGNAFTVLQSGNENAIGATGTGFLQSSNRNSATITQSSNGNDVQQVTQIGIASGTGGATLRRNVLEIVQETGNNNFVGTVWQRRSGSSWAAANLADITQSGAGNELLLLKQDGNANQAFVTQTDADNEIAALEQFGTRNVATVTLTGDRNGIEAFTPVAGLNGAWGGLTQGRIYQNNDFLGAGLVDANSLTFTVNGNDNGYGFSQIGVDNTISAVINVGSDNQTGVEQLGISNLATLTIDGDENNIFVRQGLWPINVSNDASVLVTGDGNGVGIIQSGTANVATADIDGDDNLINIAQESLLLGNSADVAVAGKDNVVALSQDGGLNEAALSITGDDNRLKVLQSGLANTLAIQIWGNENNKTGPFTGVALTTAALTAPHLQPGDVIQNGNGNSITYDVGLSSEPPSINNLFAFSQVGNGNTIVGQTIGSSNQVAVVQNGNSNLTSFYQAGIGNIIGVSQ